MSNENHRLRILNIVLLVIAVIAIAVGIVLATVSRDSAMNETLDSQNNEFVDGDDKNVDTETEDGSYGSESKSDDGTSGSNTDISGELVYTLKNGTYEVEYSGICTETSISIPSSYMGVSVTSIAADAFNGCDTLVSISIPSEITSIGERAFYGCGSLDSITIPENVTSIGDYAFYGCVSLEDINFNATEVNDLSGSNYVFYNAGQNGDGITLSIGRDVTKIPAYLFCPTNNSSGAPKIIDVVFAESSKCTSIGTYAFAYCKYIASINIPDRTESMGSYAFSECESLVSVTIPDRVTTVSAYLFYGCTSLKYLTIGEGVTTIGSNAFSNCTALEEIYFNAAAVSDLSSRNSVFEDAGKIGSGIVVTFGRNVTRVPAYLFDPYDSVSYAPNVLSVTFADGCQCTSIGEHAFYDCESLKSLTIGSRVTSIGNYSFYNCTSLEKIALEAVEMYDLSSSNYVFYNAGKDGSGITVSVSADVTKIPAYMFCPYASSTYSPNVKTVVFDERSQCTSIGDYAFYYCTSLTSITVPDGVFFIESHTFQNCSSLTEMVIPDTVTFISAAAFSGCSSLKNITLPFVGGSASATTASSSTLFGYIFGTDSYAGGTVTKQNYSSTSSVTYYIPSSLKSVTLTGGNIMYGAFYGCTGMTSITISDGLTSMGDYAFYNCTALEEIYFNASTMYSLSSGNCVFYNAGQTCSGITITIGADVGWIPSYLFDSNDDYSNAPKITKVIFEGDSQCTEIGSYAFAYCSFMTAVEIPTSVTYIGMYAFMGCTALEEIYYNAVSASNTSSGIFGYAGQSSSGITVTIGADVTSIPMYLFSPRTGSSSDTPNIMNVVFEKDSQCESIGRAAFAYCTYLTSIEIPCSVTSIGTEAFQNCTYLEEIYFNAVEMDDLSSNNYTFSNAGGNSSGITVTVGTSVTKIPAFLFCPSGSTYAPNIKTVIFEGDSQCSGIGISTFRNCIFLESINLPDSVTSIGNEAFNGCTSLISISLGMGLTSMGDYAFQNCSALEEIIYNAVSMDDLSSYNYVFYNAGQSGSGITVTIGAGVKRIPSYIFNPYDSSYYAPKITILIFEDTSQCTSIGEYAFYYCTSLMSITIPDFVTSIGNYAFARCTDLTEIYFNAIAMDDMSTNNYVFYYSGTYSSTNSSGITVTIGAGVTKIPAYLFEYNPVGNIGYGARITSLIFEEGSQCASIGEYAFYSCTSLTSVAIGSRVTSIGRSAFAYCQSLITLTIGSGVTSIGKGAFYYCTSLTSVTIPDSVTEIGYGAFSDCTSLTSIAIPDSVTSIGAYAFYNCSSLTSVTFKNTEGWSVSKSGTQTELSSSNLSNVSTAASYLKSTYYAYTWTRTESTLVYTLSSDGTYYILSACTGNFTSAVIDSTYNSLPVREIAPSVFEGHTETMSVTIPENITTIGDSAFYGCTSLTSVTIGEDLTSIGDYAFYYCTSLTSITIPDSVISIGTYAFYNCSSLKSITIPASVTSISDNAFYGCSSITSIIIPDFVTSIGSHAFYGCSSITSIIIPDFVTSIGSYAFYNCTSLTSIIIGKSLREIGDYAFYCPALEYIYYNAVAMDDLLQTNRVFLNVGRYSSELIVVIGSDVIRIPEYLFYSYWNNSNITTLVFEEDSQCMSIGAYAFSYCPSLVKITISGSNMTIGYAAFERCPCLETVILKDGVETIGEYAFYECTELKVVVLPSSLMSIGSMSFYLCENLNGVYYYGTSSQWSDVIRSGSYITSNAKNIYFYTETAPSTNGNFWHYDEDGNPTVWQNIFNRYLCRILNF